MEIKKYLLGDTVVQYLINEEKNISFMLIPHNLYSAIKEPWTIPNSTFDPKARYMHNWTMGSLVHFFTSDYDLSYPGITMKSDTINSDIKYEKQIIETLNNTTTIKTYLTTSKNYRFIHKLVYYHSRSGFETETEFINASDQNCDLKMLTSFALDNLSPFQSNDAPNEYNFHRFYGGWSLEGKHICSSIEDMSLEKSWAGFFGQSEKFGCIGSYPVERYFPTAVFEDKEYNVFWAVQLAHNSSWQMELTRTFDTLSFSGGLGDNDFCGWHKIIPPGESFSTPKAYISVTHGDFETACTRVVDMQKIAYQNYGEKGLPISFNEYCTTWGRPTQKKMLSYCEALREFGIKYAVIDAGWCKEGCEQDSNGEWNIDQNIFPDVRAMNKQIREMGMIPGIWFEFEVTTMGSKMFEPEYDHMHLKRDSKVIKSNGNRSYWDFRRADVREYLREKVIQFLKNNEFGYIKVDYNRNIGRYIDDPDFGAEALRVHMNAVRDFFIEIKTEIPEIIIENCASGGHRLEPSMIALGAVSSFSDAHEAIEVPYIAANLHRLMLPAQSLIWSVLRKEDTIQRITYSLASTFLGRMSLSGDIDKLNPEQKETLHKAINFYKKIEDVIINGSTHILGNRGRNTRYPTGIQAVVRKTNKEILVVYHCFENSPKEFILDIKGKRIIDSFGSNPLLLENNQLVIKDMTDFTGGAILIEV